MAEKRHRLRKVALAFGVLLLVLAALVAGGLSYLRSAAGGELVRRQLVAAVNGAIVGRLEVGSASLSGETVVLENLRLYTPEGELVAEVKRLTAVGDVLALLRGEIRLRSARVETPRLLLARDARGLNLLRAVEARHPAKATGGGGGLSAQVGALELLGGEVQYTDGDRVVRLEGVTAKGAAPKVRIGPLDLDATLSLQARVKSPVDAPFTLEARAKSPTRGAVEAQLFASGGGLELDAALDSGKRALTVKKLDVAESLGRAVLGDDWPDFALHVEGTAGLDAADLKLTTPAQGRAAVKAKYALDQSRIDFLDLTVADVDLACLRKGLPPTRIEARLTGALADFRPATLTASLEASGTWREPAGATVATVSGKLAAAAGVVQLAPLLAEAPGTTLQVEGTVSEASFGLKGHLISEDAGRTARGIAHALGLEPIGLSGNGTLDVQVVGPLAGPTIVLTGKLPRLAYGELRATGVDVTASLPNASRWRQVAAQLLFARLETGDTSFESVKVGLATQGRNVTLDVSSKGLTALMVRAAGRLEGESALALAALTLEWPGTTWTMQSPSRISWASGVDLEPVHLRADRQTLDVEVHQQPGQLSGRVALADVDAARLPTAFVPAQLQLGGLLAGEITASGSVQKPKLHAALKWKGGRVRTVEGVDADLVVQVESGRAKGTLVSATRLGRVDGNFDAPLALGKAKADAPVSLALQLEDVSLAQALAAAGVKPVAEGTLRLGLTVQGTVGDPRLALDASTLDALYKSGGDRPDVQVKSATLRVETQADGSLTARADVAALGGALKLDLATPLKAAEALWHPPDAKAARALQWTADADLGGLSIPELRAALPGTLPEAKGTLELKAHATGPATAPSLLATVRGVDVSSEEFRPIQLVLEFNGTPADTRIAFKATAQDKVLLQLEGRTGLALMDLGDLGSSGDEAFTLEGNVGPLDLTDVAALRGENKPAMSGQVQASFDAKGTLGAPKLGLRGSLEKLKVGKVALGRANLGWDYLAAKSVLTLAMVSSNGGQLRVKSEVSLDLSLPALKKGLEVGGAPVQASLTSRGFDLSFLSGVHAAVRTVGGELTADGTVDGKLGSPQFQGQLVWNRGRLGLAGVSEFRDIELKVAADNSSVSIDRLEARSGAGTLSFHGATERASKSSWSFSGEFETRRFPVVADDQLRAIVDVQGKFKGDASELLWSVHELSIPVAHVELPEVRKKDIQALDRPKDIVLVRDGVALGPKPRRWKKAADEAIAAAVQRQRRRVIRALLVAPRNLWVKSSDVNVELGLGDNFTVEYDQGVSLSGEVLVQRGKVVVLGRKFEVQKNSSVRFSGSPTEPYLNITAQHTNEREQVTVFATLVGKGKDFSFKTSSQPPLPESEIFALLATGRRSLKRGSGTAMSGEQAVSVLGAYAASQVKAALAAKLPIDVLDVLSVEAGSEGFSGARVEAGKYLTDRLYLGYVGQIGANPRKGENGHAGRIEYQLAPKVSVEATAGDAPAAGADIVWGTDF